MISGYTCVRNAIDLDYCVELTIKSMLPVCSEIVVGYKESTDGTLGLLHKLQDTCDRPIRIIKQPWDSPKGDTTWWTRWINETRQHLRFPVQLMLDADEVLNDNPECHAKIRYFAERGMASWFRRLNFVKDAWHLIPKGHCIGDVVARLGPKDLWMPSDEPHPEGQPEIRRLAQHPGPGMDIFHYGFLREVGSFYKKIETTNLIWFGKPDARFVGQPPSDKWYEVADWHEHLTPYTGVHPKIAHAWLLERKRI